MEQSCKTPRKGRVNYKMLISFYKVMSVYGFNSINIILEIQHVCFTDKTITIRNYYNYKKYNFNIAKNIT